jgi:hypothetical protein
MKCSIAFSITLILVIGLGVGISAAQTQAAAKPAIFAQKLVDEALAKHQDVVIIAMHVTPPGKTDNVIIASNIGRYGKKADESALPGLSSTTSRATTRGKWRKPLSRFGMSGKRERLPKRAFSHQRNEYSAARRLSRKLQGMSPGEP